MISSFFDNSYGELIKGIVRSQKPLLVVEFGILFGYSTLNVIESMKCNGFGKLISNDMFDDFPYNHADEKFTRKMFTGMANVEIRKSDFYNLSENALEEISQCEMLIVDIGNVRKTYEYFISEIYPKLHDGSIAILEGGSIGRDNYYKDRGYSTESINDFLKTISEKHCIFSNFPSITVFTK